MNKKNLPFGLITDRFETNKKKLLFTHDNILKHKYIFVASSSGTFIGPYRSPYYLCSTITVLLFSSFFIFYLVSFLF